MILACRKKLNVLEVYKLLPKTNCRKRGMTCMEFAVKLLKREEKPEDCPLLLEPKYKGNLERLKQILPKTSEQPVEVIDEDKYTECGNCVIACPANIALDQQLAEGGTSRNLVFNVINGRVKLLHPEYYRRLPPANLQCRVYEESCYADIIRVHEEVSIKNNNVHRMLSVLQR